MHTLKSCHLVIGSQLSENLLPENGFPTCPQEDRGH